MPALVYLGTGHLDGAAVKLTVFVVFKVPTNYTITCTSTPSKARAVNRAGGQVVNTFKVTRPSRRV